MIEQTFLVEDLETLKIISDPLRINLLEEISFANRSGELLTAKQLAVKVDSTLHKLYYHLNLLESHGLIRVAETRMVSGIVEKHYSVTAWQIEVAEGLFNLGRSGHKEIKPATLAVFDSTVEVTRRKLSELLSAVGTEREHPARLSGRRGHMTHDQVRLTPEQAESFAARLNALTEEFSALKGEPDAATGSVFTLLTVMIPNLPAIEQAAK